MPSCGFIDVGFTIRNGKDNMRKVRITITSYGLYICLFQIETDYLEKLWTFAMWERYMYLYFGDSEIGYLFFFVSL